MQNYSFVCNSCITWNLGVQINFHAIHRESHLIWVGTFILKFAIFFSFVQKGQLHNRKRTHLYIHFIRKNLIQSVGTLVCVWFMEYVIRLSRVHESRTLSTMTMTTGTKNCSCDFCVCVCHHSHQSNHTYTYTRTNFVYEIIIICLSVCRMLCKTSDGK